MSDFNVLVGSFTLRGPDQDSLQAECWIGGLCSLVLGAKNLAVPCCSNLRVVFL